MSSIKLILIFFLGFQLILLSSFAEEAELSVTHLSNDQSIGDLKPRFCESDQLDVCLGCDSTGVIGKLEPNSVPQRKAIFAPFLVLPKNVQTQIKKDPTARAALDRCKKIAVLKAGMGDPPMMMRGVASTFAKKGYCVYVGQLSGHTGSRKAAERGGADGKDMVTGSYKELSKLLARHPKAKFVVGGFSTSCASQAASVFYPNQVANTLGKKDLSKADIKNFNRIDAFVGMGCALTNSVKVKAAQALCSTPFDPLASRSNNVPPAKAAITCKGINALRKVQNMNIQFARKQKRSKPELRQDRNILSIVGSCDDIVNAHASAKRLENHAPQGQHQRFMVGRDNCKKQNSEGFEKVLADKENLAHSNYFNGTDQCSQYFKKDAYTDTSTANQFHSWLESAIDNLPSNASQTTRGSNKTPTITE